MIAYNLSFVFTTTGHGLVQSAYTKVFRFLSNHTTLTYVFCRKNRCHEIHFFGEMDYFLDWSLVSQGNNGISPLFVITACRRGKAFVLQSVPKASGPASLFLHMLHFDVLCFFAKLPQAS